MYLLLKNKKIGLPLLFVFFILSSLIARGEFAKNQKEKSESQKNICDSLNNVKMALMEAIEKNRNEPSEILIDSLITAININITIPKINIPPPSIGPITIKLPATQTSSERMKWKNDYFKPVKEGTWNIIVYTLAIGEDEKSAHLVLEKFETQFPGVAFRAVHTVAPDGFSNERYAIMVGQGLSYSESSSLVKKAKSLIEPKTYMEKQTWDVD
jgi:hypothetical protein